LTNPGRFFEKSFFIFCHVTENEAKEYTRVPLYPADRRCRRSTRKLATLKTWLRQSARFNPSAPPMLGAGQREKKNKG